MSTPIAVDARNTLVQVAAGHEAFEHLALDQLGYRNVREYAEGKQDWSQAGLPR